MKARLEGRPFFWRHDEQTRQSAFSERAVVHRLEIGRHGSGRACGRSSAENYQGPCRGFAQRRGGGEKAERNACSHARCLEALDGFLVVGMLEASVGAKIAIVRNSKWISVAVMGDTAYHAVAHHERCGLGSCISDGKPFPAILPHKRKKNDSCTGSVL